MKKNKIALAKKIISKVSIPEIKKVDNAKNIFNFQIGKIIIQIKKE